MKVAIIGTVGVPACYGGFETLVENLIGEHSSQDIEYTVFCSSRDMPTKMGSYKKAKLRYIPFHANGIQSLLYDTISLLKVIKGYDIILYLGASVPIFNLYKKICHGKLVMNIDGLSQFRDKYSVVQKKYLAFLKNNAILQADIVIADNKGIQDYVTDNYGRESVLIAYGGDQVIKSIDEKKQENILNEFGLNKVDYAISVCRIEPENNCHIILEAFAKTCNRLIFIGNWDNSDYGKELKQKYINHPYIKIQSPIYDLDTLFVLRSNAKIYIHGHSVGGTNPSLVEAMFFGIPILCYDVIYNRATTFDSAGYFSSVEEIVKLLSDSKLSGEKMRSLAYEHYTWRKITHQYEDAYKKALGIDCN